MTPIDAWKRIVRNLLDHGWTPPKGMVNDPFELIVRNSAGSADPILAELIDHGVQTAGNTKLPMRIL